MLTLKRFLARYCGSSMPTEIETEDGVRCVLKMKGAGNGTQSLLAEWLVNRAARALRWPVPDAFAVAIRDGFPWEFGTDEFDDIVQKSYGVNLGLDHLGPCQALDGDAVRSLPRSWLTQMASLDALFRNYDRLPASGNVLRDLNGAAWLVDHGSCLFLNADGSERPLALGPGHLLGSAGLRLARKSHMIALGAQAVRITAEIPEAWLRELGASVDSVRTSIESRVRAAIESDLDD